MSFIQLKRKICDDPKEILILASKKRKIQNVKEDTSIFELAATATQKEEINDVINKGIKGILGSKVNKINLDKITDQLRIEHLERSKHNRLHILNCKRNIDESTSKVENTVPVIDISHEDEDTSKNEEEKDFVYDIYYSHNGLQANDLEFIKNYSILEVNSCVWQENNSSDDEQNMEDEDDSNDENNWRNDYPDEDEYDLDSNDEDDFHYMSRKLRQSRLSDNSLSSDDFDEAINAKLFNSHRKNKSRTDSDIDYYDEVVSDESESS